MATAIDAQRKAPVVEDLATRARTILEKDPYDAEALAVLKRAEVKASIAQSQQLYAEMRTKVDVFGKGVTFLIDALPGLRNIPYMMPYLPEIARRLEAIRTDVRYADELDVKSTPIRESLQLQTLAIAEDNVRGTHEEKIENERADQRRRDEWARQEDEVKIANFESQVNVEVLRASQRFATDHDRQPSERELKELRAKIRSEMLVKEAPKQGWASRLLQRKGSRV